MSSSPLVTVAVLLLLLCCVSLRAAVGTALKVPTQTAFTSVVTGATYTVPKPKPLYLRVTIIGGGGGGGSPFDTSNNGLAGVSGSASSFGVFTAGGGTGGSDVEGLAQGGTGGTASAGTFTGYHRAFSGQVGQGGQTIVSPSTTTVTLNGGSGGASVYSAGSTSSDAGYCPGTDVNGYSSGLTGNGGAGGYVQTNSAQSGGGQFWSGGGGGSGAFIEAVITNPKSSYTVTVGAGGAGAAPAAALGVTYCAGSGGSDGLVLVEEFYQ